MRRRDFLKGALAAVAALFGVRAAVRPEPKVRGFAMPPFHPDRIDRRVYIDEALETWESEFGTHVIVSARRAGKTALQEAQLRHMLDEVWRNSEPPTVMRIGTDTNRALERMVEELKEEREAHRRQARAFHPWFRDP